MAKKRVIYQNWLVDIGYDPNLGLPEQTEIEQISIDELFENGLEIEQQSQDTRQTARTQLIITSVKEAMRKLTEEEQELIIRFHFMGEKYIEIAEKTEREIYSLVAFHKQTIKKLKKYLTPFVKKEFELPLQSKTDCILCSSENLKEINLIIAQRDKQQTWKHVMYTLSQKFNIEIKSPQILIGHEKYHC